MFRAVSPLIAAILLIAFTISIGVMIIGWGRQYVQQQASCMGLSLEILKAKYDSTNKKLNVTVQNTGTVSIVNGTTRARIFLLNSAGDIIAVKNLYQAYKVYSITENDNINTFSPGEIYTFEFDNINEKPFQIYIEVQGCGKISNDYYP